MTALIIIGIALSLVITFMMYCCLLLGKEADEKTEDLVKKALYEKV